MAAPRFIVLVGLMGSGKSAVARRLASSMDAALLDTDTMVEDASGRTVREMFADDGEEVFRAAEENALRSALSGDGPAVIAAAGGVVTRPRNRDLINRARQDGLAWVVWLRTDPEDLVERVSRGGHRPLLDDDPRATLLRLHEERAPMYEEVSDTVVDTTGISVDEVTRAVAGAYSALHGGGSGTNG